MHTPGETWQGKIKYRLSHSSLAGDTVPLLLSIIVGLVTGIGAYIFILLLAQISSIARQLHESFGFLGALAFMMLAGLITGTIIARFALEAKGHGVPEVMEAIALKRGRIRPRVALAKIIASAITIGSGGSAGREGPIVQVGSAFGSTAGQWAKLSDDQVGMLVASGAAAGIAATFNAPIAGTLFALEVILGRFNNRYLGIVVIASVSANIVSRILLGENPAFAVPTYGLNSAVELPFYFVLGIVCAGVAIIFIRVLYRGEHIFDHWNVPLPIKTSVGMGLTALLGFAEPNVLGPGLEFIGEVISDDLSITIGTMFLLFIFKLAATTFTLGSGNSGGVFAPALFMGAMIGGIFGHTAAFIFPELVTEPGAFALVGMAAVFAGSARAPITAIIIVLEMSNDYRLILPLLMTVIISTLIADVLHPDSIYTRKLILRGIRIQQGQDIDLLQGVKVREVVSKNYPTVSPDLKASELTPLFNESHHHGFPIVDERNMVLGVVTLTDVERTHTDPKFNELTVKDIGTTKNPITVYPTDPIYLALRRLNTYDIGRLPVVSEDGQYLGMVRRADILRAYEVGLVRKSIEQHQQQFNMREVEDNEFMEILVEHGAPMIGHTLVEFPYSSDCHIISLRRKGKIVIPKGDTRIQVGDIIVAYVYPECHDDVLIQFKSSKL